MSSTDLQSKEASINLQSKALETVLAIQSFVKHLLNSSNSSEVVSSLVNQTVEQDCVVSSISNRIIQIGSIIDRLAEQENLLRTQLDLLG